MQIYTGCSGYYYNHWRELFYPVNLPKNKWLPYYAQYFKTVEVNSTFYNLLSERALKNWYDITPEGFVFTLKGYRYITHTKKLLLDPGSKLILNEFLQKALALKEKLGCILWQLPPQLGFHLEKLSNFCKFLSAEFTHVIEFRHVDWYQQETFDFLQEFPHISFCMVSAPGLPEVISASQNVAYLRFHGKTGWYNYNYSKYELEHWAENLKNLKSKKVYSYFNNDAYGYAVQNSQEFDKILKEIL